MTDEPWVDVKAIKGGQLVVCKLCGKLFRRAFYADDSNYAEALRRAVAYASTHRMSDAHQAAAAAFHSEPAADSDDEEALLAQIFGRPPRTDVEGRRVRARRAARRVWESEKVPHVRPTEPVSEDRRE